MKSAMRIAAGKFRGRRLAAPTGQATRPTGARVREALFDILGHGIGAEIADAQVLDIFAGAGALGLEALSRGAASAVFMEQGKAACTAISENAASLAIEDQCRVIRCDATEPPKAGPHEAANIAFMDPPYRKNLESRTLTELAGRGWLAPGAILTVEHSADQIPSFPRQFDLVDQRAYGATGILFLSYIGEGA